MEHCTDAAKLGVYPVSDSTLSPFARFYMTFLGRCFLDNATNTIKTKTQIYHRDPVLAIQMAHLLLIPKKYELLDSLGWKNGKPL